MRRVRHPLSWGDEVLATSHRQRYIVHCEPYRASRGVDDGFPGRPPRRVDGPAIARIVRSKLVPVSSSSEVVATGAVAVGAGPAQGRLIDELAALVVPVVMPVVRRLPAVILVVLALFTTVCVVTLWGAARDDAAIEAHSAVATAEVLPGSGFSRTLIRFTTADGQLVLPERGVFYPDGLQPGQIVRVEYDYTQPDRVRVLDRDASVGWLPIGLMLFGAWVTLMPLAFWLRGRQLLKLEALAEQEREQAQAGDGR